MNKKFYVPFETAILLKAKGYPQKYIAGDHTQMYYTVNKGELISIYMWEYQIEESIAAPAYCEVIDWLVQKEIYIDVDRTTERVVKIPMWHCYIWEKYLLKGAIITGSYPTREQAINAAIIKVLEGI